MLSILWLLMVTYVKLVKFCQITNGFKYSGYEVERKTETTQSLIEEFGCLKTLEYLFTQLESIFPPFSKWF